MLLRLLVLSSLLLADVRGHGFMTCPKPRQYRGKSVVIDNKVHAWTKWVGIRVPGNGEFIPGIGNAPNSNAAIGGGADNALKGSKAGGHGLCGDLGGRNGFMALGPYGPTPPRGIYKKGEPMKVEVKVTAYHWGWFEFRLEATRSQRAYHASALNEHVEIDPSTPLSSRVIDSMPWKVWGAMVDGINASLIPNQPCPQMRCGPTEPAAMRGTCSPPSQNTHRYVLEKADATIVNSHRVYTIHLKIPSRCKVAKIAFCNGRTRPQIRASRTLRRFGTALISK